MAVDQLVACRNIEKAIVKIETLEPQLHVKEPLMNLRKSVTDAKNMLAMRENLSNEEAYDMDCSKLGSLLCRADDLLDEIITFFGGAFGGENQNDSQSSVVRVGGGTTRKVRFFFSSYNSNHFLSMKGREIKRISHQIGAITRNLLIMSNTDDNLQREVRNSQRFFSNDYPQRGSKISMSCKNFASKIIESLVIPKTESKTVINIVGSPGLGKSTLAKFVYDSSKVSEHFDKKIWVSLWGIAGDENEIREKTIKRIVESSTKQIFNDYKNDEPNKSHSSDTLGCRGSYGTATTPTTSTRKYENSLEKQLQKLLKGKRVLLILDDASSQTSQLMQDLFAGAPKGCNVLVLKDERTPTSRSEHGVTTGTKYYPLCGLDVDESMSLLESFAFDQEKPRERRHVDIAFSIARSMNGNPLAIKVAASLLYERELTEWSSLEDDLCSQETESIMDHVLHYSYSKLPTHLKACVCYCSLFPPDFIINKHDLISLWCAQGYIDQQSDQSLNTTAENYFLELCSRCFLEAVSTDVLGKFVTCKMHPVIHSLASKQAAVIVTNPSITDDGFSNYKHVSFSFKDSSPLPDLKHLNLKTFLLVSARDCQVQLDTSLRDMLLSSFKSLRVLDLHNLGIEALPSSIGKLNHLRYLDLSKNVMFTLPKSVTKLYYLQTLKLNSCISLQELPGDYGSLVNLTRFEVDECDSLTSMPLGLNRLTKLEILNRFIVSKDCSKELRALKELKSLRGRLTLELSGDWASAIDESLENCLCESQLDELEIIWRKVVTQKSPYEKLLEHLEPNNTTLKSLSIQGYKGKDFPEWIKNNLTNLQNLVIVSIEGCGTDGHLPPFGKLTNLKRLTLRHMANVRYVEDSTNEDPLGFPCLEELTLDTFYNLEGWRQQQVTMPFPYRLSKLNIWNCPNLKNIPLCMYVKYINLRNVSNMLLKRHRSASMQFQIWPMNNARVQQLQIKECQSLKSFEDVRTWIGNLSGLRHLVIEKCNALPSLANELKYLTSLQRLEISSCKELDLYDYQISKILRSSKSEWASMKFLKVLILRDIPKMKTLPEGLRDVQSLRSLSISSIPALTELPEWITLFTVLQHLRVENCQYLARLSDFKKDNPRVKVDVIDCPKLARWVGGDVRLKRTLQNTEA